MRTLLAVLSLTSSLALVACGDDDGGEVDLATEAAPVLAQHAVIARAVFADSAAAALELQEALDAFTADPTAETLAAARTAWIAARVPYRQTESLRFYGGPIDDPADEREPGINAWPLDEAYIDSVEGDDTTGIINDVDGVPAITAEALAAANFVGGEANVTTGYHAIEFLLWGQDLATDGPGARPHTDFVDGEASTRANADRRRAYLTVVGQLLVDDLDHVAGRWADGGDYAPTFTAGGTDSLVLILTGLGTLSASELSGERMLAAYTDEDQEAEHSCFSDTTLDDLIGNARSLENVYLGRYGSLDGAGIDVLVAARDPELDTRMKAELTAAIAAVEAIPGPFDQAILGEDAGEGRTAVLAAIRAIQKVGATTVEIATLLGLEVSTDL